MMTIFRIICYSFISNNFMSLRLNGYVASASPNAVQFHDMSSYVVWHASLVSNVDNACKTDRTENKKHKLMVFSLFNF